MTDLQHISVPLVDPNTGRATTVFYRYLRSLVVQTTEGQEDPAPALSEVQVTNLYSQVQDLMYTLDELIQKSASESKLEALYSQVQDMSDSVSELDNFVWAFRASSTKDLRYIAITGSAYEAVPGDFINASQRGTITFPKHPADSAEFFIRNADNSTISLHGNGRKINGSTTGALRKSTTAVRFKYFKEPDEWFAI